MILVREHIVDHKRVGDVDSLWAGFRFVTCSSLELALKGMANRA